MANKCMKRCSISLIIKEVQIKTTMKYHLALIRMTTIKNGQAWWLTPVIPALGEAKAGRT